MLAAECRELAAIPLGREEPDCGGPCAVGGGCDGGKKKPKTRTVFPELNLWSAPAETWELPAEGMALIRYKVVAKEKRDFINSEGEPEVKHSITFQVQELEPVESKGKGKGKGAATFAELAAACRELRLRDEDGVFVPSAMGAADPRLHAAAYDLPGRRKAGEKEKAGAEAVLERLLLRKRTMPES